MARDFLDTLLSWLHQDGGNTEHNYIFDTERTCREAYDHARRTLYNFGASTATALANTCVPGKFWYIVFPKNGLEQTTNWGTVNWGAGAQTKHLKAENICKMYV